MKAALALALLAMAAPPLAAAEPAATVGTVMGPALRSSDIARSTRFYTAGLGLVLARKIETEGGTEAIFTFATGRPPMILLFTSKDPAKAGPIALGDGYGRTLLGVADADGLVARLKAAGYAPGEVHANAVNHMKTFWVKDPDGYAYEISERPGAAQ
jgi:catechol 2,3-dioxygenase-like lactoylglutathione lyase family enzyme